MKIRSITCFYNPIIGKSSDQIKKLKELVDRARESFGKADTEIQTSRLATIPFPKYIKPKSNAIPQMISMEEEAIAHGFEYLSIGPCSPKNPEHYELIPGILKSTKIIFTSGRLLTKEGNISLAAAHACARIIQKASKITDDGFTNCRFAATANVKAFCPFFPSAYSKGDEQSFSLAMESADLVLNAYKKSHSLEETREGYSSALHENANNLQKICNKLSKESKIVFRGLDFSTAPFPTDAASIGSGLEQLGFGPLGNYGSLAAAAQTASILGEGKWKKAGFNGLMLPVMEDSFLAKRYASGEITIKDLLLYSAVCGTGLDTVPLPGDISISTLEGILLDVAALSARLKKPLTARLMPIPGKKAGDETGFTFDYFANTKVMEIPENRTSPKLGKSNEIRIKPRK